MHCPKQTLYSLGVLLDLQQLLKQQMTAMARRAFAQLYVVYWFLPFLDWEALLMITHVLINSWMDYCNTLYMNSITKHPSGAKCDGVGNYVFHWQNQGADLGLKALYDMSHTV